MVVEGFAECIVVQLNRVTGGPLGASKDSRRLDYPIELDSMRDAMHGAGVSQLVGVVCRRGSEYAGH
jgi:hypothetical protein